MIWRNFRKKIVCVKCRNFHTVRTRQWTIKRIMKKIAYLVSCQHLEVSWNGQRPLFCTIFQNSLSLAITKIIFTPTNTIFEKTQGSQSKSLNYVKQFSKNVVSEIQTLKFQTTRLTILGQNVWWRRFSVNLMFPSEFTNMFHY